MPARAAHAQSYDRAIHTLPCGDGENRAKQRKKISKPSLELTFNPLIP